MSQGLGSAFDRAQRAYDARLPLDDDPMRYCIRCRELYDSDAQVLDSKGEDICDDCLEKEGTGT